MSARNKSTTGAAGLRGTTPARSRTRLVGAVAAVSVAGAGALALASLVIAPIAASASTHKPATAVQSNCTAAPSKCGYPDATNTGVPAGTTLLTVPAQISSGPGWHFVTTSGGFVQVTGDGAVLSGLYIPYNVNVTASNVTIKDVKIIVGGGASSCGISLRHTAGVTIENSSISGTNVTTGRIGSAIDDLYGDSTGITVQADNISAFKTGVQVSAGLVTQNYIHDPGYVSGDHTNGVFVNGGTQPLTISRNTILNNLGQTDAINLDSGAAGEPVASKTIQDNLLAGGSYAIYAGASLGNTTSGILIEGNRFGQGYYATSGQYGTAAYFASTGTGNAWNGNIWDTNGQSISSP